VRTATIAFVPPFYTGMEGRLIFTTDRHQDELGAGLNTVRAGFFDAIGLTFVSGRDFSPAEVASTAPMNESPVVLVESLARRAFGAADISGNTIIVGNGKRRPVVGVVRDTLQRRLSDDRPSDLAFQPFRPNYRTPWVTVVIGQTRPGAVQPSALRDAVAAVDPALPIFDVLAGQSGVARQFGREALTSNLAVAFALLAMVVAAAGLYGVVTRGVTERRRELGIRRALGATSADLAGVVTGNVAGPVLIGLGAGTVLSLWLSRFLAAELYGMSSFDAISYGGAAMMIVGTMLASVVPGCYEALHIDPASAMRE
jgi:hypothetical protein